MLFVVVPTDYVYGLEKVDATVLVSSDKRTEIAANMRQARHLMEKGDYVAAKRKLVRVLELDKDHAEAKTLLAQCEQKIEAQKTAELKELNNALEAGTEQALRGFIERYPEGFFIEQAENYLQDFHLWDAARRKGTKDAYIEYLSTSTVQGYKKEAELAIKTIDAEAAWEICKKNMTINKLEEFINDYTETPFENEARYELYLIKAESYYDNGPHATALKFYEDANKIHSLTGQHSKHYRELVTEQRYNQIRTSNSVYDLKDFLSRTSMDSPYYNPISNRLAIVLANNLNILSTEEDFKEALKYAKDNSTRILVKQAIDNVKIRQRDQRRQQRQQRHVASKNRWKGNITLGLNIFGCYLGSDVFEMESGFMVRFGQSDKRVNFLVGADLQLFMFSYTEYNAGYSYPINELKGKFAIPMSVRLNLGKGYNRHWYLGLGAVVYPNLASTAKPCIAIEPQLGYSMGRCEFAIHLKHMTNRYGITEKKGISNLWGAHFIFFF